MKILILLYIIFSLFKIEMGENNKKLENIETQTVYTTNIIKEKDKKQNIKIYYDIPLNEKLQDYIKDKCKEYDVEFELVLAVIQLESDFDVNCISYNKDENENIISKDIGLMQINNLYSDWYAELANLKEYNLLNPYDNIQMGIAGLSTYKRLWEDKGYKDEELTIRMLNTYNMGEGSYKRFINKRNNISRAYDRVVFKNMEELVKR